MDEILELQQQLAAVQQKSSAQKLSERNCIELVMKLQSLQLIDLIFTRSGKEYLTPSQLTLEISDEIISRGGRVNVIDLPDALNVELYHIQSALPQILDPPAIRLVRGEVLTDYYLASVAEEINDALTASEHGLDNVGTIASRYALPVDVIRETVATHLKSLINATLDPQNNDLLRSAASIARDRAAARGLLRATTAPTVIADLAKVRQLSLPLVSELVADMLHGGELLGTVAGRGSRAVYVPQVFSESAQQAALSAFAANGFIKLDRLTNMHIPDASAFVETHLQGPIILGECAVGPALVGTLATSASEVVSEEAWLDVEVALPPDFPVDDVSAVMIRLVESLQGDSAKEERKSSWKTIRSKRKAKSIAPAVGEDTEQIRNNVFGDRFIVSPSLIKKFSDILVADALRKAQERATAMTEKMSTVVTQTGVEISQEKPDTTNAEGGKKGKGKGRRRAGAKDKSLKVGKGFATEGAGMENEIEFPISKPSVDEAIEIILSDDSCSAAIETDYLGSSTAGDEMISCLVENVYGDDGISALYQNKAEEAVVTLLRERAIAKKNAEKALLTDLEAAEVYNKSASSFAEEELVQASRRFVIDNICVNALCRVVDSVSQNTGIIDPAVAHAHELKSKREKLEILRVTIQKLAPALEIKIRALLAVVGDKEGGTVEEFLNLYDENVTIFDLPERRPVDKRAEKAAFASSRAQLSISLNADNLSGQNCLRAAAVLVHAKTFGGTMVVFPSESTVGFCKAIEEKAKPAEVGAALRELREMLTIKKDPAGDDVLEKYLQPEAKDKLAALREFIG